MSESNYDKLNFGRTLHELSNNGDHYNHGDCYNSGSVAGCDEGCPQLRRGDCEAWSENIDIIKTDEELMLKYKNKLEELSHE